MLKNYFKTAIRHLIRQKSYTLISIVSLVVGMTCFLLLLLYARYESSFDSSFKNSGRIYQIGQILPAWNVGGSNRFPSTSGALAAGLKREFPEVEYAVRVKETETPIVYEQNSVLARGLFVDGDFLSVFSYPLSAGEAKTALQEPFTAILSESLAGKLFGRVDPLGKIITHMDGREFKVTGIIKDIPRNTHLKFDYLLSFTSMYSLRNDIDTSWGILNYFNYIMLREGVSRDAFEPKLKTIVEKYHPLRARDRSYFLTPVSNMHFETDINFPLSQSIDKKYIALLLVIAGIILIIACVNYLNLATARSTARSKEVGVRKAFGADRSQLIKQFMGESYLLVFFSIIVSVLIVGLVLPAFRKLAVSDLEWRALLDWRTAVGLLGLLIAVGFLSGSYPALLLSSLSPSNVFKNSLQSKKTGGRLKFRNCLVVVQFFATIVLLVAAVVIQKQLHYIRNTDIGYQRANIVALRLWDVESKKNYQVIKAELLGNPNISAAAVSNVAPVRFTEANDWLVENESGDMVSLPRVTNYFIDFDYFNLFGMTIVRGRNFSPALLGDIGGEVVINETAARMAGLQNPVGKAFVMGNRRLRVIGVVKDIHFTSLKTKIGPLMFTYRPAAINLFFARISGSKADETIRFILSTFRRHNPAFVSDFTTMDDIYNALYQNERKLAGILISFSVMAILIASIGLFGLISFIVEKKKKEIGIRKVLGAPVFAIMGLIIRDLFALIAVAGLMALPVAYYFSHRWLGSFAYRIRLDAGVFLLATSIVMLIALLSVARVTMRAARENPARSLRNV